MGYSSEGGFDGMARPRRDGRDPVCLRVLRLNERLVSKSGRVLRGERGIRGCFCERVG